MSTPFTGGIKPILRGWSRVYSGKVRDLYRPVDRNPLVGQDVYLVVASDRMTVFDRVIPTPIPDKGKISTALSTWWFEQTADVAENHHTDIPVPEEVRERGEIVRALHMLPYEIVVRGYITERTLREINILEKLGEDIRNIKEYRLGDMLPEPYITAARKASPGNPDKPISWEEFRCNVGEISASTVKEKAIALYNRGHQIAANRGLVMADAKFEFGTDQDAGSTKLVFADEAFTPDSARYWLAKDYREYIENGVADPEGTHTLRSYDKEMVASWLTSSECTWDRSLGGLAPPLPQHIVDQTRARYVRVFQMLTGQRWD